MTSPDLRCPQCGAHTVAGADWCTLCYVDLRPAPDPEPVREPAPERAHEPAPVAAREPVRGKHARRATPSGPDAVAEQVAGGVATGVDLDVMLAQLAAESGAPLGSFMNRFDTKGSRILVVCGGVAAVGLVLLLAMTLLGSLL